MSNKHKQAAKPVAQPTPASNPEPEVTVEASPTEPVVEAVAEPVVEPAAEVPASAPVATTSADVMSEAQAIQKAIETGEPVIAAADGAFQHSHAASASFGVPKSQYTVTDGAQAVRDLLESKGLKVELTGNGNVRVDH